MEEKSTEQGTKEQERAEKSREKLFCVTIEGQPYLVEEAVWGLVVTLAREVDESRKARGEEGRRMRFESCTIH